MPPFTAFDPKDPDDIDAFTWGFGKELATGETISSYTFPGFPGDLTLVSDSDDGVDVTAMISGGSDTENGYDVTCRATTSAGRQLDFTLHIPIAEQ